MQKREKIVLPSKVALTVMIWVLAFQSPLQSVWPPFSYIDEVVALFGACLGLYDIVIVRKGRPSKEQLWIGIPLLLFIFVGLAGNLIYQYQPLKCVIIDLYTNLKFFLAIGTGYYLFNSLSWEAIKKTALQNSQLITFLLFLLFLIERVHLLWCSGVQACFSGTALFYAHPTYLAGTMAFLLVLMTTFYDKKNLPCIVMAVLIMAFTLRAKALASATVYVLIFVFFLIFRWKLKFWHAIAAGVGSVVIAWDKIRFYFIDLGGHSARSVMLQKSFAVLKDHFPIGSGFGTFGSAEATKCYSPVYLKYDFNNYWELRDPSDIENSLRLIYQNIYRVDRYLEDPSFVNFSPFLSDHFWPIIFGQTGAFGTVIFLVILGILLKRCMDLRGMDVYSFAGLLFAMSYLLISSIAETAFHNAVAIPLAVIMGIVFKRMELSKE